MSIRRLVYNLSYYLSHLFYYNSSSLPLQLAAPSTLTFTVDSCRRDVDLKRGEGRKVCYPWRENSCSRETKVLVDAAR
jgi:hypothetical protein